MSDLKTSNDEWTKVDEYYNNLFIGKDPALDHALAASDAEGLPSINVAPNQGKLLFLLARAMGAKTILEIGTLGGYSTIWLARALPQGGRLITLEVESRHASVAQSNINQAGLDQHVELRLGRAVDSLARLVSERTGPFDLIFIDADKPSYSEYFSWSLKLSRPGTIIIADNVVRKGAVADPDSHDELVLGIRRFNEAVSKEPRVTATALQTVGVKGYDGIVVALVTA